MAKVSCSRWARGTFLLLQMVTPAVAQRDIITAPMVNASAELQFEPSDPAADLFPLPNQATPVTSGDLELTLLVLFFVLLLALLFICTLYSVCGKSAKCRVLRRVESQSFDAMVTRSRSYFREDLVDDDEILRLWICLYCDFANYEVKSHCALCGNEKYEKHLPATPRSKAQSIRPASLFSSVATTNSSSRSFSPSFLLGFMSPTSSSPSPLQTTESIYKRDQTAIRIDTTESTTTSPRGNPEPSAPSPRSPSGTPFTMLKRRKEWQPVMQETTGNVVWGHHSNRQEEDDDDEFATSRLQDELVVHTAFVNHNVLSPKHPHGKLKFKKAEGAPVYGSIRPEYCNGSSGLDPFAIDALRGLSFPEKHRWFMQETTAILHVRWNSPTIPTAENASDNVATLTTLVVPRDNLFHGTMRALIGASQKQMRRPLRIKFKNEPGVDAGGIVREWFSLVMAEFLDETNGLFQSVHTSSTADSRGDGSGLAYTIHPSASITVADHLLYYRAFGRLLGKALLEGHLIPVPLADFLLKHILSVPVSFADLEALDEGLARSLLLLWHTPLEDTGDDNDDPLGLDFSVYHLTSGVVDLKKNGRNIAVTEANKLEYIALYTKWHLGKSVAQEVAALISGIYDVLPIHLLAPFDYQELRLMLCGSPSIDLADWEKNTVVVGKKTSKCAKVVAWFWKIVAELPMDQRCRLLQFATGAARVPVQGFKALTSNDGRLCPFTIYCIPKEDCAFVRAYTCFNRLDLPMYKTEKELRIALHLLLQLDITGFSIQ